MLQSVRHRVPVTVPVGAGIADLVLEDNLPLLQVLQPVLLFVNTHPTLAVTRTVTRRMDLGVSADPEDDGVFDTEVVSAITISANGGEYIYEPPVNLVQGTTAPLVQHLVDLSHLDVAETPIVQILVSGMSDIATRENILNFTRLGSP